MDASTKSRNPTPQRNASVSFPRRVARKEGSEASTSDLQSLEELVRQLTYQIK
jgi:hypothetical protein